MKMQIALVTCVAVAASCRTADAQEQTPIPPNDVLQRFVGAWELKSTLKPAKWNPEGGEFTGRESTVRALQNRIIMIRDMSQPGGKKGLFIATHDPEQDAYPFWGFDSNGLSGAKWLLKWNADAGATVGQATDLPRGWTSGGTNRFPDADTNLVSFWIRDENGELLLDSSGRKDRLPADREAAIVAAWEKNEPAGDLPAELNVLDRMVGDWNAVSTMKPAEWTPDGGQSTMKIKRRWILNGRFVMDTPIHPDGREGISLFGFDPNQNVYQGWRFTSEGEFPQSPFTGSWNAKSHTLTFASTLDDGKTQRTSVRFPDPHHEVWEIRITDADGRVYFDMDIVATRRLEVDDQ